MALACDDLSDNASGVSSIYSVSAPKTHISGEGLLDALVGAPTPAAAEVILAAAPAGPEARHAAQLAVGVLLQEPDTTTRQIVWGGDGTPMLVALARADAGDNPVATLILPTDEEAVAHSRYTGVAALQLLAALWHARPETPLLAIGPAPTERCECTGGSVTGPLCPALLRLLAVHHAQLPALRLGWALAVASLSSSQKEGTEWPAIAPEEAGREPK